MWHRKVKPFFHTTPQLAEQLEEALLKEISDLQRTLHNNNKAIVCSNNKDVINYLNLSPTLPPGTPPCLQNIVDMPCAGYSLF